LTFSIFQTSDNLFFATGGSGGGGGSGSSSSSKQASRQASKQHRSAADL
jgi:hypothetical protein